MKLLSALSFLLILATTTACTKVCEVAESAASTASSAVATKWGCTNPAAMQADFKSVVSNSFVCQKKAGEKQGAIGNMVCPLLTDFVRGQLANQVPPAWGCNPALVGGDAAAGLASLCASAFPF